MPSFDHEIPLQLFRNGSLLVPERLQQALQQTLPPFNEARLESGELTQLQPEEYHVVLVVLLKGEPVSGIVIEAQLSRDTDKADAWPVYVTNLHTRLKVLIGSWVVALRERRQSMKSLAALALKLRSVLTSARYLMPVESL